MRSTVRRAFTVVGALLLVMAMALPASAKIEFHRIVYNPSGSDTGTNWHLNREFVVLHNTGSRTRRIGNWRIRDLTGHRYTLPDGFRLGPDRYVRVHTGRGRNDSNDLYWGSGWYIWNNTGDRATLKNAAGTVIDRCRYDGRPSGVKNC